MPLLCLSIACKPSRFSYTENPFFITVGVLDCLGILVRKHMRRLKCNKDNTDVYKNSTLAELLGLQLFFSIFFQEKREEFLELKLVFWPKSLKIIGLSKARVLYDGYGHIHSPKNVGMQS